MATKTVTGSITRALATLIKTKVPGILEIYDDFPNPSQALKYPSGSIFTGAPKFKSLKPREIWRGVKQDDGKTPYAKVMGEYEFALQLDLWVKTKYERHELYEKVWAALTPDTETPGISILLTDYHNRWARYYVRALSYPDSEQGAQRGEWRVKIDIIADVDAVNLFTDYLMETFENRFETPEAIEVEGD